MGMIIMQLNYAVDAIFEEIERIKSETVGFDVVERVRRKAKYHLAENFETNEGHISGIELKLDRGLTPELCIKGFDGVTPERVREVANKYLPSKDDEKYILCIESPLIES